MADDPGRTITCPRCGGAAPYAGMVGMPANTIYQCNNCGRAIWVPRRPGRRGATQGAPQQQQQPQPDPSKDDEN